MEPKIVERGAFHVVGLRERFEPGKVEGIPRLWDRFVARSREIRDALPGVHYGVSDDDSATGAPGFLYTACVAVPSPGNVPEGMVGLTVPAGRYAVFTHKGPIRDFGKTMEAIFRDWLPASGMRTADAPCFELYDERFRMDSPDSEVDVYVPIAGS